ncbi:hypothetical protein CONPUDRAFT_111385, partial [Coniophora puteana RWD-64-598 SS2]
MANAALQEIYEKYVDNDIPVRLLDITDLGNLKLFERWEVKKHFQPAIYDIVVSDEDANPNNPDRDEKLLGLVKGIVRYAIFSHRWGDLEPLYTHMVEKMPDNIRDGPGYDKLQNFCRKAKDMDCTFAWSDTCCIDKRSSADLDENIRSMFRFYLNSHICIAYLANSTNPANLTQDAWFTRGWTLQELVAPSRIKFYMDGWMEHTPGSHNDKIAGSLLLAQISQITTIPESDLSHFKPGTDRVSQKMSWAAARTTTRIEDMAYSLIGIFDVSLMVAYGEGERAFFRLMEAILQRYNKWDVFAW